MNLNENFMRRAFDLAQLGIGKVSPNPLVGCLVTFEDMVIGEGWHKEFGGPHAEVIAIGAVSDKKLLPEVTVYVNLEPCSHHGKTPPCTDLLIRSNVKKVIVSSQDPNPKVGGRGIMKLREHGIEVTEQVLYKEGRALNKRFFTNQEKKRPYIILKWAQSSDRFLARENYSSKWISSVESRKLVHKWRAEEDAVLVGRSTAHYDNPRLDTRDWRGSVKNPVRVVIDPQDQLQKDLFIKDQSIMTWIYNYQNSLESDNLKYIKIDRKHEFLPLILTDLLERGIGSVLVEGGSKTLQYFLNLEYWDEARVFTAPIIFEKGIQAPEMNFPVQSIVHIGDDLLHIYRNKS